jgi:hypothetical protein
MKRTPNTGPLTEQEKKHVQKLFEGMDKAELRNMTQVLREVYVKGAKSARGADQPRGDAQYQERGKEAGARVNQCRFTFRT